MAGPPTKALYDKPSGEGEPKELLRVRLYVPSPMAFCSSGLGVYGEPSRVLPINGLAS